MKELKKELYSLLGSILFTLILMFFLPKSLIVMDLYNLKKSFIVSPLLNFMFNYVSKNTLVLVKSYVFFIFFYLMFLCLLEFPFLSKDSLVKFLSFFLVFILFFQKILSISVVIDLFIPTLVSLMFFYLVYNFKKIYLIALTLPIFVLFPISIVMLFLLFLLKKFEILLNNSSILIILLLFAIVGFVYSINYYYLLIFLFSLFLLTTFFEETLKHIFLTVLILSFLLIFENYLGFCELLIIIMTIILYNMIYKLLFKKINLENEFSQISIICSLILLFLSYTLIKDNIEPINLSTFKILDEYMRIGGKDSCTNSYLLSKSCNVNLIKEVNNNTSCNIYFLAYFSKESNFEDFINSLNNILAEKYKAVGLLTIEKNDISSRLGGNIIIYKKATIE